MRNSFLHNGNNPNFPMFASSTDDGVTGIMLPYEFVCNMDIHTNCPTNMRHHFFNRKNTFILDAPNDLVLKIYDEISRMIGNKSENSVWLLITSFTTPNAAHDYCKCLGLKGDIEWYTALTLYKMANYINAPKSYYAKFDMNKDIV